MEELILSEFCSTNLTQLICFTWYKERGQALDIVIQSEKLNTLDTILVDDCFKKRARSLIRFRCSKTAQNNILMEAVDIKYCSQDFP